MTENEKIELFDKWYDENYDEWAEGEEGIALREELEQAFKSGIATLEKENAELDCQKNRNKFCYSCANATERCFRNEVGCPCGKYKSYKDENAKLKTDYEVLSCSVGDFGELQNKLEEEQRKNNGLSDNLTKAKELLKEFVHHYKNKTIYIENMQDLLEQVEQFIKDSEVEK